MDRTESNRRWREGLKKRVRKILGKKCKNCGTEDNLEMAHIKPTPISGRPRGRGQIDRLLDVLRYPDCYRMLCSSCHYAHDHPESVNEPIPA